MDEDAPGAGIVQSVDAIGAATGQQFAQRPASGARQPGAVRDDDVGEFEQSRATGATVGRPRNASMPSDEAQRRDPETPCAARPASARCTTARRGALRDRRRRIRLVGHGGATNSSRSPASATAARRGAAGHRQARSALRRSATRLQQLERGAQVAEVDRVERAAEDTEGALGKRAVMRPRASRRQCVRPGL